MSILFEPFEVKGLELKNRFMRSATTSYYSDDKGVVRPEIIELYRDLARGEVGLIVKGHLYVSDKGKAHEGMAGISQDYHIPKLRELVDAVHSNGGIIAAQLNHAGINSIIDKAGPSEFRGVARGDTVIEARELYESEILEIVKDFGVAAERAVDAGFDMVQIHGAHGYLISQFLSRYVNKREDGWGDSLGGRMKLLRVVYQEIRERIPDDMPLMVKINSDDFTPTGFLVEDAVRVAEELSVMGIDLIEVSGGGVGRDESFYSRAGSKELELSEADFVGHAKVIREKTGDTPLALVSGIRTLSTMEAIIERDIADMVSMCRPFIMEPDLVKKLNAGQQEASCITCDACRGQDVFGKTMLRCYQT
jgi:2,4-dienoyl-CoA reductase-like NADH-dependent reductase (Old Yellow Enzyme family)